MSSPNDYPALRAAWWLVAVLFVTACFSYADRLVLSVLVDPLRQSLGLSDSAIGVVQGPAFTLVYVFAALFFGRLADRRNRRNTVLAGATAWCIATILCGLANSFETLLAARMLLGVSEAALLPASVSMIADSFAPERRGTAVGLYSMGTVIGGPLGISAGGALLSAAESGSFSTLPVVGALEPWRAVLVAMGVIGLLSPVLLLMVREPRRQAVSDDGSWRAAVQYVVSERRILVPLYLGMAMLSIGDYGLVSWVPATLSRRFEWGADQSGLWFGVITSVAGVGGALCGGWFSDLGRKLAGLRGRLFISIIGGAIATAGALAVAGNHAALVLAGLGLWVFASTVAAIGAIAILQEVVPNQFRGTAVSILTFCNTLLGLGCGPTLVALATDHIYGAPTSVGFAISTAVVPAGVIAMVAFAISRRQLRNNPVAAQSAANPLRSSA
jgi:MFS family permease